MDKKLEIGLLGVLGGFILLSLLGMIFYPVPNISTAPHITSLVQKNSGDDSFINRTPKRKIFSRSKYFLGEKTIWFSGWRDLERQFKKAEYNLVDIISQSKPVPRIFMRKLPSDLKEIRDLKKRKQLFIMMILPLILLENEKIQIDRARLWKIITKKRMGEHIKAIDRLWLAVLADRFKTDQTDYNSLLNRVDCIPPALALAQAAAESGWGTSRFAQQGNAIFGQWTTQYDDGLIPRRRDKGKTHRVKVFESLSVSIGSYIRNLNTHPAYRRLRHARAIQRAKGKLLIAIKLVDTLENYSEEGSKYIKNIHSIMLNNDLQKFDEVKIENN